MTEGAGGPVLQAVPASAAVRRGVAVVTGGSAGIGRATVERLAGRGWDVGVIARGQDRLDAVVHEVEQLGRRACGVSADVADAALLEAAAAVLEATLGPIDVWVNCAFTGSIALFADLTPAEFDRITAVTYLGYVNGTRAALSRMVPRQRGTVIQVGSALAFRGIPLQSAYCGAKHAIRGYTEAVRTELMHQHSPVRVCEVHMPAVNTPQFDWVLQRGVPHHAQPVPPIYQPEVAARAVAHVAEHPRRTLLVGMPTVLAVWGNRLAPALLDRYLARTNVKAQQSPAHGPGAKVANTWDPVPGAHIAAHGAFDEQAHPRSAQLWASTHRGLLGGALLGGALAAAAARTARR